MFRAPSDVNSTSKRKSIVSDFAKIPNCVPVKTQQEAEEANTFIVKVTRPPSASLLNPYVE